MPEVGTISIQGRDKVDRLESYGVSGPSVNWCLAGGSDRGARLTAYDRSGNAITLITRLGGTGSDTVLKCKATHRDCHVEGVA
jgi:hypothetical protein